MDFFETVEKRRSIRPFGTDSVPEAVIRRAFEAAILAPNSSNLQTWDFYWVRKADAKAQLSTICLNQAAARTAAELIVVTADAERWRRSQPQVLRFVESVNAPGSVLRYYKSHIPKLYKVGPHWALLRFIKFWWDGLKAPMMRGPLTRRDQQEIAIKSAALAAENFVLGITAQGYDTCMMEGFDLWRLKKLLKLPRTTRVLMVIAVGKAPDSGKGTWGPRFRMPLAEVVHEV